MMDNNLMVPEIMAWQDYLAHQRRFSKHTLLAYHNDVSHFFSFLTKHLGKEIDLNELETIKIQDCRAWLASRYADFHARSNARALASVKSFWRYLLKQEKLTSDVIFVIKAPKVKKTLPRPLTQEQAEFLTESIDTLANEPWVGLRDKALVVLLYSTGMRISEALSLLQGDLEGDILVVKGKGNKERQIPFLKEAQVVLGEYMSACPYQGKDVPLFLGLRGKVLQSSAANAVIRSFRRLYNLPETLTPHALRHTCASHLMSASGDLRGIQTLLGHASLSSTQVYTDLDTAKLLDVYQKAHPRQSPSSEVKK